MTPTNDTSAVTVPMNVFTTPNGYTVITLVNVHNQFKKEIMIGRGDQWVHCEVPSDSLEDIESTFLRCMSVLKDKENSVR